MIIKDIYSIIDEYIDIYSIIIQDAPDAVPSVETQYLDFFMIPAEYYADVKIVGDGTVQADGLYNGYYTFNFYDSSYNCIGYTAFYMDENGAIYSYDTFTKLNILKYSVFE